MPNINEIKNKSICCKKITKKVSVGVGGLGGGSSGSEGIDEVIDNRFYWVGAQGHGEQKRFFRGSVLN